MFDDVLFDFTDKDGKVLDTIVIAGVNGSGKTSLLQLLQKLFSESLNLFKVGARLHKYQEEENALLCDEVEVHVEFSAEEKINLKSLTHKLKAKIAKMSKDSSAITNALRVLEKELKNKIVILRYKLEKDSKGSFTIIKNDFRFFGLLPEDELKDLFRVFYFSSNHSDIKKPSSENTLSSLLEGNLSSNQVKSDGIVSPIDIFSHTKTVENYILSLVQEKIFSNRELTAKEAIEKSINEINAFLNGINIRTVLCDITPEKPIFKSFTGSEISSDELSGGEKQLYYKAVLLNKLNPQNSLIFVDEPETSLHPTWQQDILKLYSNLSGNNQVILVTHSPHLIASVHPDHLFLLKANIDSKHIECVNAARKGLHTKGSEPNDILSDIMGTPLRDLETRERIRKVFELLKTQPEAIQETKNWELIESLMDDLGSSDSVVMRISHRLSIIEASK